MKSFRKAKFSGVGVLGLLFGFLLLFVAMIALIGIELDSQPGYALLYGGFGSFFIILSILTFIKK